MADVHGVMRSAIFRHRMRLYGIPTAHIDKEHTRKRRFIRQGGSCAAPLRHTVLRYCDVFRRLGFEFDDPRPFMAEEDPKPTSPARWNRPTPT